MRSYRKLYRVRKKKSILKNRFFVTAILGFLTVSGIFYLTCFFSFFQIKEISISGNSKIPTQVLSALIEQQIPQEVFFAEMRSIFLVDSERIKTEVLAFFPNMENIEIRKNLPDSLKITIKERGAAAVLKQGEKYFLMDQTGVVFEETATSGDFLIIEDGGFQGEIQLGKQVIFPKMLSQILETEKSLREKQNLPSATIGIFSEQKVVFGTVESWEIYFNFKKDLNWQISGLTSLLENKLPPEKRKELKYIDLRFNKIYVSPEGILD